MSEESNYTTVHRPGRRIGGRTNGERAAGGGKTLAFYARQMYGLPGEDVPYALGDLICDILHFAAAMGYTDPPQVLEDAVRSGLCHYDAETIGEPHEGEDGGIEEEEPPFADGPMVDPGNWYADEAWG